LERRRRSGAPLTGAATNAIVRNAAPTPGRGRARLRNPRGRLDVGPSQECGGDNSDARVRRKPHVRRCWFAAGIARVARSRNVRDLSDPDPVV
jgi:hypothetical protein